VKLRDGVSARLFSSWQMAANQMCQPSAVCHLTLVLSPAPPVETGSGNCKTATGSGTEISSGAVLTY